MTDHADFEALRLGLEKGLIIGPYGTRKRLIDLLDEVAGLRRWKTEMLAVLTEQHMSLREELDAAIDGTSVGGDIVTVARNEELLDAIVGVLNRRLKDACTHEGGAHRPGCPQYPDWLLADYLRAWPMPGDDYYPPRPPDGYPLARAAYEEWVSNRKVGNNA